MGDIGVSMQHSENKPKILVVEDDADIQKVLCVFLEYADFAVCSVMDGQEAIRVIPEFSPDLIVLDLLMQPISGWEVLDWLRNNHCMPVPPVLVLSALTHLTDQVRGFEEGALEYLTKPTQPSKIVESICSLLALSAEQRALLRDRRMDEQRRMVERLNAPQQDEFIY
jgi:DNA-binding response OmpR family regulator